MKGEKEKKKRKGRGKRKRKMKSSKPFLANFLLLRFRSSQNFLPTWPQILDSILFCCFLQTHKGILSWSLFLIMSYHTQLKITSIKFLFSTPFPQGSVDTWSAFQVIMGNIFLKCFATASHGLPSFQPLILGLFSPPPTCYVNVT